MTQWVYFSVFNLEKKVHIHQEKHVNKKKEVGWV